MAALRAPWWLLAASAAGAWRAAAESAEGADADKRSLRNMDMGVSVMLLGSVAFMMGLFYLTNQSNKKKATDSWKVISSTISIFSAVLLFQGISGIVDAGLLVGASKPAKLAVSLAHMLVWLVFLQFFLAYVSGAVGNTPEETPENKSRAKLNVECFAVLLGHISGFAAIKAFATAQEMLPVGPLHKFLAVPISWACIHVWGQLFDYVREKVCVLDDGEKDFFEELWDDMAEETEDDVIGLTASFLTAQTLRYSITGNMPNAEGDEAPALVEGYSNWNVSCLIGWGFAMVIIEGVRLALIKKTFKRFTPQLQNVMAMNMAWSLFFGFGWFMGVNFPSLQGMLKHVVVALGLTFSSMLMIFVLDSVEIALKASHKKQVSKTADTSDNKRAKNIASFIESIVVALAILIGFSWEKAFDVAVEGVAKASEQRVPEHATKLLMGVVLAGVVVPAWRLHILPHIEKMNEELEEEEEEEEAEEEEKEEKEEAEKPGREGAAERRRSSREARGPPALEQAAGAARPRGGDELRRPLLGGGGRSPGRDAAGHEARMAELAGLKAEVDGKLDAVIAQLGVLDRRSAELVAGRSGSTPPKGAGP